MEKEQVCFFFSIRDYFIGLHGAEVRLPLERLERDWMFVILVGLSDNFSLSIFELGFVSTSIHIETQIHRDEN